MHPGNPPWRILGYTVGFAGAPGFPPTDMMFSGPSCTTLLAIAALLSQGCGLREHPQVGARRDGGAKRDVGPRLDSREPEPGITIDGTEVPRSRAIVFIHFGHSN